MKESLVDVSPSIVMRLKGSSAGSCSTVCSSGGAITASVATKPSIVAMFGRIMPAPLAMPVIVTVLPPICTWRDAALGSVSVVMMPSAACAQWSTRRSASAAGRPASMRSTGSVSMITPVENGSTCSGATPSCLPKAMQVERARAKPSSPVPALALPVLISSARIGWPPARNSRHSCTGAAQKRLRVKTPATALPSSSAKTTRSLRLALRTPAMATPMRTPGTAFKSAAFGALRLTGMARSGEFAVAVLVLLAASAGAGVIAADLGHLAGQRMRCGGHGGHRVVVFRDATVLVRVRVGHVADCAGALLDRLGGLRHLFLRLDAHGQQDARDLHLHHVEQLREQLEGLALVLLLRVLLRIAAQVDALAQIVQRRQVLAPMRVERLQQHHAHEGRELLQAHALQLVLEQRVARLHDLLDDLLVGDGRRLLDLGLQRHLELPLLAQRLLQAVEVPLFLDAVGRHEGANHVFHRALAQVRDLRLELLGLEDVVALLVDDLALVVGDVVVLEQLLADVEVARLDLALRAFQAARDDAGLDGLAVGHLQPLHDRLHAVAGEDAHQRVFQRQVEARRARVALAAGAAAQLVVDAPALVALGGDDAQAAGGLDLPVPALPLVLQLLDAARLLVLRQALVGLDELHLLLDVAAKHDVGPAAGHVGGDGDHLRPTGLRDDLRFLRVLLGVEHLLLQAGLVQQARDELGVLDRRRAHQHRLAALVAVLDVLGDRLVLLARGLVDEVELVLADGRLVRRDDHGLEAVDFLELVGLGIGRARHAGELAVHAEIVLEGDRGEG